MKNFKVPNVFNSQIKKKQNFKSENSKALKFLSEQF